MPQGGAKYSLLSLPSPPLEGPGVHNDLCVLPPLPSTMLRTGVYPSPHQPLSPGPGAGRAAERPIGRLALGPSPTGAKILLDPPRWRPLLLSVYTVAALFVCFNLISHS